MAGVALFPCTPSKTGVIVQGLKHNDLSKQGCNCAMCDSHAHASWLNTVCTTCTSLCACSSTVQRMCITKNKPVQHASLGRSFSASVGWLPTLQVQQPSRQKAANDRKIQHLGLGLNPEPCHICMHRRLRHVHQPTIIKTSQADC